MPLRVHCPSGCFIRIPSNRAGKIVRCPECKKVIQLATVTASERQSGKPIPMSARIVSTAETLGIEETDPFPTIDATSDDQLPLELPQVQVKSSKAYGDRPRLMVPKNLEPPSVRRRNSTGQKSTKIKRPKPTKRPALQTVSLNTGDQPALEDDIPAVADSTNTQTRLRRRVSSANADRAMLSRFFAVCLCVVAAINLAPATYFWIQWSQTFESTALPRWIYLQAFIAAMHLIYAVFLVQIRDWSALKAVSIAMLAVAFVFGLVSTGLIAGSGQGIIAQFLELPHVLTSKASIWCVAMLCLSTLMCYMGGRVAVNWQRTEQLLREIIS